MTQIVEAARLTRRHLLVALGAGVIGSGAAAAPLAAAPTRARAAGDLQRGLMADWAARVGERFDVAGSGALRLVSVEPLCSGGPSPARSQCFAAVFETAAGPAPEGDSTFIVAPRGGRAMPLYLGAPAEVGGRSRLVAVFN